MISDNLIPFVCKANNNFSKYKGNDNQANQNHQAKSACSGISQGS